MQDVFGYIFSHLIPIIVVVGILSRLFAMRGRGSRRGAGMPTFGSPRGSGRQPQRHREEASRPMMSGSGEPREFRAPDGQPLVLRHDAGEPQAPMLRPGSRTATGEERAPNDPTQSRRSPFGGMVISLPDSGSPGRPVSERRETDRPVSDASWNRSDDLAAAGRSTSTRNRGSAPVLQTTIAITAFPGEIGTEFEGITSDAPLAAGSSADALRISVDQARQGMIWAEILGPPRARLPLLRRR